MFLKTNEHNEILSFATIGEIDGGLKLSDDLQIPDDFEPRKYKFAEGKISVNLDFEAKKIDESEDNTIEQMKATNARLMMGFAELTNEVNALKGGD
ncbi:DUF2977 domain-containing protein [Listeria seeligeri]|uniref:DUF2977 domain-containing protein n=1 Tax=Listeria seeligeri TaxID=1640 RepID=UPI0001C4EC45|nr:DUF2977 domain-containing protein [Listeria seeligeri]CBH27745.1 hypothetical protein lse_1594 [Listeria seeligeri serovar 1/2b str. SLCC3954]